MLEIQAECLPNICKHVLYYIIQNGENLYLFWTCTHYKINCKFKGKSSGGMVLFKVYIKYIVMSKMFTSFLS